MSVVDESLNLAAELAKFAARSSGAIQGPTNGQAKTIGQSSRTIGQSSRTIGQTSRTIGQTTRVEVQNAENVYEGAGDYVVIGADRKELNVTAEGVTVLPNGELAFTANQGLWTLFAAGTWTMVRRRQPLPGEPVSNGNKRRRRPDQRP